MTFRYNINPIGNIKMAKIKMADRIEALVGFLGVGLSNAYHIADTSSLSTVVSLGGLVIKPTAPKLEILTKIKVIGLLGTAIPDGSIATYVAEEGTGSNICILNRGSKTVAWVQSLGRGDSCGEILIDGNVTLRTSSRELSMGVYPTVDLDKMLSGDIEYRRWLRHNGNRVSEEYQAVLDETESIHHILPLVEMGDVITIGMVNGDIVEVTKENSGILGGYVKYTIPSGRYCPVDRALMDGVELVATTKLVNGVYDVSIEHIAL